MNALVQGSQTPGEVATSSSVKGRSESPANSMWRCGVFSVSRDVELDF